MKMLEIFQKAHEAGMAAGHGAEVAPMVICEATVFGQPIPGGREYVVEGGPCGFAWITMPGRGKHVEAAKQFGARKGYPTGLQIRVHEFGQSLARKEKYAYAFARVLEQAGIPQVYAESRMD